MANTTNFGWETPDDTDLVKDGAAAIRTLGNSIDTSLVDLKGGTTGQVLSKASNTDMDFTWTAGGDITEVVAGTGLSGGGTSGSVTLTNTVATAFDAAGDLVYGTGADTFTKLAIGTAGQVLKVNSGATAVEWGSASAAFSGCRVTKSGTQTISTATNTLITFDTETFDTNSYHSTVTNTSRLTAPSTGYYSFDAQVNWDFGGTAPNNINFRVLKNGTSYQEQTFLGTANRSVPQTLSGIVSLTAGDYIEMQVYQASGVDCTIINANGCTSFTIKSLGA